MAEDWRLPEANAGSQETLEAASPGSGYCFKLATTDSKPDQAHASQRKGPGTRLGDWSQQETARLDPERRPSDDLRAFIDGVSVVQRPPQWGIGFQQVVQVEHLPFAEQKRVLREITSDVGATDHLPKIVDARAGALRPAQGAKNLHDATFEHVSPAAVVHACDLLGIVDPGRRKYAQVGHRPRVVEESSGAVAPTEEDPHNLAGIVDVGASAGVPVQRAKIDHRAVRVDERMPVEIACCLCLPGDLPRVVDGDALAGITAQRAQIDGDATVVQEPPSQVSLIVLRRTDHQALIVDACSPAAGERGHHPEIEQRPP